MNGLMELYEKKEVEQLFSEKKLINLLMNEHRLIPEEKKVNKKQIIMNEGEKNEYVFYIKQGIVAFKKQDTFLSFSKEAHFVGLETFLFNDVQPYTVEAMEKLEVLVFKKIEILDVLMAMQEGWLYLYLLNKEEKIKIQKSCSYLHLKGNHRSKKMLTELAKDFGISDGEAIILPKCFGKKCVTNYLGLSFNTGKALFEKFRREGFLLPPNQESAFRIHRDNL
ncbi:cyclic nucleotide-binding domain-containing protein [Listeria booriae]|uniref:Crp/Fnr family transcriptional regulator n=1 Tax=Listeria booriae TaxID=1552123 RepID=A0A7X1DLF8_9LIST|nr:Crp/Fnr family transcriptional regulator [Listeria booriae]MBC2258656.1 Crp/Fnr family transcriptional regulator [Listeria booriae]MBC2285313.1 Crp/Fnr family transcriptional regulator [Listeria booriae]MBC2293708.1 Crp/Fnr family transcriptional regulator [Listeria booriae]MBC2305298.1 Crp/Fnr family transcriptional regulator [Listeria booriae]MBC2311845.1 Crp/Fnr family transcriptional regulator [Listeria booriae]